MKSKQRQTALPEIASFTRYYEQDGMLRAYANRAMYLAALFGVIALGSLGFAIYVRVQPPTVIRVDKDGNAAVVGATVRRDRTSELTFALSAQAAAPDGSSAEGIGPSDLEGRAVVRRFLDHYLSYTPDSAARNLAESLNMMTANLPGAPPLSSQAQSEMWVPRSMSATTLRVAGCPTLEQSSAIRDVGAPPFPVLEGWESGRSKLSGANPSISHRARVLEADGFLS